MFFEAENSGKLFVDVLADYGRMMESVQRVIDWRLLKLGDYQFAAKDLDGKQQRLAGKPEDSKLKTQLVTVIFISLFFFICLFLLKYQ